MGGELNLRNDALANHTPQKLSGKGGLPAAASPPPRARGPRAHPASLRPARSAQTSAPPRPANCYSARTRPLHPLCPRAARGLCPISLSNDSQPAGLPRPVSPSGTGHRARAQRLLQLSQDHGRDAEKPPAGALCCSPTAARGPRAPARPG